MLGKSLGLLTLALSFVSVASAQDYVMPSARFGERSS